MQFLHFPLPFLSFFLIYLLPSLTPSLPSTPCNAIKVTLFGLLVDGGHSGPLPLQKDESLHPLSSRHLSPFFISQLWVQHGPWRYRPVRKCHSTQHKMDDSKVIYTDSIFWHLTQNVSVSLISLHAWLHFCLKDLHSWHFIIQFQVLLILHKNILRQKYISFILLKLHFLSVYYITWKYSYFSLNNLSHPNLLNRIILEISIHIYSKYCILYHKKKSNYTNSTQLT